IIIFSYDFFYKHLDFFDIQLEGVWVYVLGFLFVDFSGYWMHRFMHNVNYFWNEHSVHHSGEIFTVATAFRQPISNILSIYGVLLIPAALLRIDPFVIGTLNVV